MNPETEAFLESVRDAEDPTLADEERVLRALQVTVAAGALVSSAAATAKLTRFGSWSVSGGFKGGAAVVGLLAIGGLAAARWGATLEPVPAASRLPAALPTPAARRVATVEPTPLPAPTTPSAAAAASTTPARAARPPAATAPPALAPAPASAAGLRAELLLLARAQAALRRGDGAAALSTLDAAPAGQSQLGAERATLRILALCALGRAVEAERVAAALERSEPGSLQRDVISRSCAGGERSPR